MTNGVAMLCLTPNSVERVTYLRRSLRTLSTNQATFSLPTGSELYRYRWTPAKLTASEGMRGGCRALLTAACRLPSLIRFFRHGSITTTTRDKLSLRRPILRSRCQHLFTSLLSSSTSLGAVNASFTSGTLSWTALPFGRRPDHMVT